MASTCCAGSSPATPLESSTPVLSRTWEPQPRVEGEDLGRSWPRAQLLVSKFWELPRQNQGARLDPSLMPVPTSCAPGSAGTDRRSGTAARPPRPLSAQLARSLMGVVVPKYQAPICGACSYLIRESYRRCDS